MRHGIHATGCVSDGFAARREHMVSFDDGSTAAAARSLMS
jgi:hypothetical protein